MSEPTESVEMEQPVQSMDSLVCRFEHRRDDGDKGTWY